MKPLSKPLRTRLENTVKAARDVAETAARAALEHLGVGEPNAPAHLTEEQRELRRRLRLHGRQLGDVKHKDERQDIRHLVWEVAYEHWHRMLFARFLAENHLLMHPDGVAVSLADCEELAKDEGAADGWELAGRYAARMLPQVFRKDAPALQLRLAPEHQRELAKLVSGLDADTFRASDSLGWVYQFWQAKRKDEVNAAEVKIGADELPAVTQLFTEPYMVEFLLHNSLGAWWVTRHPGEPCPVPLTYLRTIPSPSTGEGTLSSPSPSTGEGALSIPSPSMGEGALSIPSPSMGEGTLSTPSPLMGEGQGGGEIPAAGKFEGWPDSLKDFKLLDPCCGSGHFLVAAFHLLVPMRMQAEGLSAREAVDAVIADNLYGLEIDPRCVEIAAFALALAAWTYPDLPSPASGTSPKGTGRNAVAVPGVASDGPQAHSGAGGEGQSPPLPRGEEPGVRALGFRPLPRFNIACCGLKVSAKAEDWAALVPDDAPHATLLRQDLKLLHASMREAPLLGSLLDPWRSLRNDLATSDYAGLQAMLSTALTRESPSPSMGEGRGGGGHDDEDLWDAAVSAQGLLDAARILGERYHLVITNVPYLARGRQSDHLKAFCAKHYPDAKNDLANVFLERCLELAHPSPTGRGAGGEGPGVVQIVMPQNWLFLSSFKRQRENLLKQVSWNLLARLGSSAFETITGEVVNVILITVCKRPPMPSQILRGIEAAETRLPQEKSLLLREGPIVGVSQQKQLNNPNAVVAFSDMPNLPSIGKFADVYYGSKPGQTVRVTRSYWEIPELSSEWMLMESTPDACRDISGKSEICLSLDAIRREGINEFGVRGKDAWGKHGVIFSKMQSLPSTTYLGEFYDDNTYVLVPRDPTNLPAFVSFMKDKAFNKAVRQINQKLNVTRELIEAIPFNLTHWQKIAAERYPNGLPKPYSDDPTQWIFHGHPKPCALTPDPPDRVRGRLSPGGKGGSDSLQVAVARLLGYRWPAEHALTPGPSPASGRGGDAMELSDEARAWIAESAKLAAYADDDGIVCLPPVRGEKPAAERLLDLLIAAWGADWQQGTLDRLLAQADCAGKSLDYWLRERFFEQHCKRFRHRPFIWHVWDGLKDGFAALVNYHKLDRKNLETLIYTYLGDWIRSQERAARDGADGADLRLAAAQALKTKLEKILEGEAPYDIFVRWKPLERQPIGWDPDLNDGVRLNIRPFVTAEVLRHNKPPKLNIKWDKDRGKDVESAPWFKVFKGERINDHHLTLAQKRAVRDDP